MSHQSFKTQALILHVNIQFISTLVGALAGCNSFYELLISAIKLLLKWEGGWRGSPSPKQIVAPCESKSHFRISSISLMFSPHLQLAVQVGVRRHHMFVLFLAGDLDERLLGLPVPLLELVHHGRVLALDEAVQVVLGVAAANHTEVRRAPERKSLIWS